MLKGAAFAENEALEENLRIVEAKLEAVVLVTDQLKGEVDEIKADLDNMFQLSSDTVNDIVTERLDERDAKGIK